MKQRVTIFSGETTVFNGRMSDIPIKPRAIKQKSIELFDDDDPCIIHQSYVIKEYVDVLLEQFIANDTDVLVLDALSVDTSFLDLPKDQSWSIQLVKK